MGNSQPITPQEFKQKLEEQMTTIYPPPETETIKIPGRRPKKEAPQHFERVKLESKPLESTEHIVNARDGRKQVLTTSKWPYSVHGLVSMKFNNTDCCGTGIMIGPNVVLTAGHNLYSHKLKAFADPKTMLFMPGMNGQVLPFGSFAVVKYFVSPKYEKQEIEDYGILILKEPIGEVTGYFGLACLEPENLKTKRINVTGYPGDKVASKPNTYEMWGMEGEAAHVDKERDLIHYLIDTDPGQSGSGVWYQEGEDYYVCGVHVLGSVLVNKATLLTRAMYQQILAWLQQTSLNEKLFELKDRDELNLHSLRINGECVSLLKKYSLENLTQINLNSNRIEAEGAKSLSENTSWVNLSVLRLHCNNICPKGAQALAQNTSWVNLSLLDLSSNNIGVEGAKALAQNNSWPKLSHLNLSSTSLGAEGARVLALNTSWVNLLELNLSDNNIGAEGALALADNISWTNLSELDLLKNNIGNEGVQALILNTSWLNLSHLSLSENNIDDKGARALAQNTSWVNLSKLHLCSNNIGAEGVAALAQNISWINLSELDLIKNNIGNEGARALVQNTSWINLSKLHLSESNIDDEGAGALAQNTSWVNLSVLSLWDNNITVEGDEALRKNETWKNIIIGGINTELFQ